MSRIVGQTENNFLVYIDVDFQLDNKHLSRKLLREVISKISIEGELVKIVLEFERAEDIGLNICTQITEKDNCFNAIRNGKKWPTKFVIDKFVEPCKEVAMILKKENNRYNLIIAVVGGDIEPEVLDLNNSNEKSAEFWKNNALVYNTNTKELITLVK